MTSSFSSSHLEPFDVATEWSKIDKSEKEKEKEREKKINSPFRGQDQDTCDPFAKCNTNPPKRGCGLLIVARKLSRPGSTD